MKKNLVLIVLVVIASLLLVGVAVAQALEPQELQPTFILMDGTEKMGLVYGLDYGWVIMVDGTTLYTCGCGEEVCTLDTVVLTEVPTNEPTDPPGPTPPPTEPPPTEEPTPPPTEPPQERERCNRGIGNGSEDCDPGNSGGNPGSAGEDNE